VHGSAGWPARWPLAAVAEAQLGLCVLAFAFGSLTKNSAHLIFWMIGVILVLCIPMAFPELFFHYGQKLEPPGSKFTQIFVTILVLVVTGIALTLNQYLCQSRKRSIAILAFGVGLSLFANGASYSVVLLPGQRRLDDEIAGLSAEITHAAIAKPKPGSDAASLLRISLKQIAPHSLIYPYYGVWSESEADHQPQQWKIYLVHEDSVEPLINRAFDFVPLSNPSHFDFGLESNVPAADVTRFTGRPATYHIQVALDVRSFAIEGQMELVKGAVLRSALGVNKITSATCDGAIMRVEIDGRNSGLNPEPGWFIGIAAEVIPFSDIAFALVNAKTKTVLMPARTSSTMFASAYCMLLTRAKLQFILPPSNNPNVAIADWQLVKVRLGTHHQAVKSFTAGMTLKETPRIELDPAWLD
jgi:hypothetical protein